jgi:hypothetical protein
MPTKRILKMETFTYPEAFTLAFIFLCVGFLAGYGAAFFRYARIYSPFLLLTGQRMANMLQEVNAMFLSMEDVTPQQQTQFAQVIAFAQSLLTPNIRVTTQANRAIQVLEEERAIMLLNGEYRQC